MVTERRFWSIFEPSADYKTILALPSRLYYIARFLNLDIELLVKNGLKRNDPLQYLFYDHIAQPGFLESSKKIQKEMLELLIPIVLPEPRHAPSVGGYLEMLVARINKVGLKSRWTLEFGTHKLLSYESQSQDPLEAIKGTEKIIPNTALRRLGPGHRIVGIRGTKWIVTRLFYNTDSLEENLYGILINSLEVGDFSRLRRCEECLQFYVAQDIRQKYCSRECRNTHHTKDTKRRVENFRARKRHRLRQEEKRNKDKKIIGGFTNFLKIAARKSKTHPEIYSVLKTIGGGRTLTGWKITAEWLNQLKEGQSPTQIFNHLSSHIKNQLEDIFAMD